MFHRCFVLFFCCFSMCLTDCDLCLFCLVVDCVCLRARFLFLFIYIYILYMFYLFSIINKYIHIYSVFVSHVFVAAFCLFCLFRRFIFDLLLFLHYPFSLRLSSYVFVVDMFVFVLLCVRVCVHVIYIYIVILV